MASSSSSSPEISAPLHSQTPDRYKYTTLDEVLDDLSSRFILNLPDEELTSLERICFQVEQAHWFYEDFIREESPKFPSLPLKKFSEMLFQACPLLHHWSGDHEGAFNHFMQYKTRVPVCGAIMLNDTWDKVVLVKGWKSSSGWGFPKGKINQNEAPHACAAREVAEETGYNLNGQIDPDDVIEMSIREQLISLYIVPGVPEDYSFETKTRKEISKIEWFRLSDLPTWKRNKTVPGKFYLISPFIGALKAFINERKPRNVNRRGPRAKDVHINDVYVHSARDASVTDFRSHTVAVDSCVQESGSQASSADNGDPQTPSPLYSEARVTVAQSQESTATTLTSENLDPHFARLLNALSVSAKSPLNGTDTSAVLALPQSVTPAGPVPHSTSRPSSVVPDLASARPSHVSSQSQDWSIRGPRKSMDRASVASPLVPAAAPPLPRPSSRQSKPSLNPPSIITTNQRADSPARSHLSSPPPSATLSTTSSKMSTSQSSNRRSMTADISPYLSRPAGVPMNGKRLKQLALLESVADESARMSPAPRVPNGPPVYGYNTPFPSGLPPPLVHVPPHSTSVPPPNFHNLSSMYPYTQGPFPPPQHIVQPPPFNPQLANDNDFTVRPRTSNAFRPIPNPPPRRFNTRGSMNQAQLLSALTGAPAPSLQRPPIPPMGSFAGPPPFAPSPMGTPLFQTGPSQAPLPVRVVPPQMLPGHPATLGLGSGPALSPTFDVSRGGAGNNTHLLNILNTRGPGNGVPASGAWNGTSR